MPSRRASIAAWAIPPLLALVVGAAVFADHHKEAQDRRGRAELITGGKVDRGRRLFSAYGCGGCHSLSGVPQARGLVGPALDGIGSRAILAGRLENKPENLIRWIGDPQAVAPGTAMPRLGVTPQDQRDIAAFLYDRS
ncbi:MAG TPA: cytochrome c [Allosphingosinicella sp.]|nr:cytochrome c [Allosphingosinicella sp.]